MSPSTKSPAWDRMYALAASDSHVAHVALTEESNIGMLLSSPEEKPSIKCHKGSSTGHILS